MDVSPIHSRLFGGKSTPAMRAIKFFPLSLTLAVLGVGTDHAHHAAPMHDLALHADFLYRCTYLHVRLRSSVTCFCCALLVSVNNPAARQVIRRKLHRHAISRQNTNKILAHLSRNMGQHLVLIFQLHSKHGIRKRLDHGRHHLDGVLFPAAFTRFLLFLLWPWFHALLSVTPANSRCPRFTKPAPPPLSGASESTGRSWSPRRYAQNAPNRCRPRLPPSTHHRAPAHQDRPYS